MDKVMKNTIIASTSKISPLADIEESVRGTKVLIKDQCVVDSFVKIKTVGGSGDVIIDEGSYINSGTVIYSGNGVQIGKKVLIAANCTLAPVNHEFKSRDIPIRDQGFRPSKGGIIIEDDVWLGSGVVVLDGAHIRQGAIVAAGTVVKGEVPAYAIVGGNPLKVLKYRGESHD